MKPAQFSYFFPILLSLIHLPKLVSSILLPSPFFSFVIGNTNTCKSIILLNHQPQHVEKISVATPVSSLVGILP
ncbi:hypothetical protein RND81_09G256700 [Saponaria officinalis]|uniref:Secreted protein n=1 Tax=Saponaria officinalis TaxID=3572 RepID=A0AAW1IRM2_SAPOF